MTELNRIVRRRTRETYNVLYSSARHSRQIVIELKPGDVLEFRELGRRIRFALPIEDAFRIAVRRQAQRELARRRSR